VRGVGQQRHRIGGQPEHHLGGDKAAIQDYPQRERPVVRGRPVVMPMAVRMTVMIVPVVVLVVIVVVMIRHVAARTVTYR
jgi:hypothetical protein